MCCSELGDLSELESTVLNGSERVPLYHVLTTTAYGECEETLLAFVRPVSATLQLEYALHPCTAAETWVDGVNLTGEVTRTNDNKLRCTFEISANVPAESVTIQLGYWQVKIIHGPTTNAIEELLRKRHDFVVRLVDYEAPDTDPVQDQLVTFAQKIAALEEEVKELKKRLEVAEKFAPVVQHLAGLVDTFNRADLERVW